MSRENPKPPYTSIPLIGGNENFEPSENNILINAHIPREGALELINSLATNKNVQITFCSDYRGKKDEVWIVARANGHLTARSKQFSLRLVEKTSVTIKREMDAWFMEIYDGETSVYRFTHPALFEKMPQCFEPFAWNGKLYALFEKAEIEVISLPDGARVAKEVVVDKNRRMWPTQYHVPLHPITGESIGIAFAAGTTADNSGRIQIQQLDLRRIEEGVITRSQAFGDIALPDNMKLADTITIPDFYNSFLPKFPSRVTITCTQTYSTEH